MQARWSLHAELPRPCVPPEIISHAVWLYHRFCLSFRDVEDLLSQRGTTVSCEAIRMWWLKFGPEYARRVKLRQGRLGDTWHLDEVFVPIQGRRTCVVALASYLPARRASRVDPVVSLRQE